jgi:protein TonB
VDVPVISLTIRDGLPPVDSRIGTIGLAEFASAPRDTLMRRPDGVADQLYTDLMVERQVSARPGNLPPRYPDLLRSAGVEGTVYAQFVVDTLGRVERESIRFTRGGHSLFERAVVEALLRSRYSPAEADGRKVRQLVEQAFSFTLRGPAS